MKAKLALVTWLDATRTDEAVTPWGPLGVTRRTVGWLLRDDDEGVVLAMTEDNGDTYERGFTIPRAYVISVGRLVLPSKGER